MIIACNTAYNRSEKKKDQTSSKCFFDFNQIDYYYFIDTARERNLYNNEPKSADDSLLYEVYSENINSLSMDTSFLEHLERIGYDKISVNSQYYMQFSKIFSMKKKYREVSMNDCLPAYRDIFVFRKDEKISGVAKICFTCDLYNFIGTQKGFGFGMQGEFEQLEALAKLIKE